MPTVDDGELLGVGAENDPLGGGAVAAMLFGF